MLISLSQIHFVYAHNPLNISFKHSKSIIQKKGFVLKVYGKRTQLLEVPRSMRHPVPT